MQFVYKWLHFPWSCHTQRCQSSGNFLISGNFSLMGPVQKYIGKSAFSGNMQPFQDFLTTLTGISAHIDWDFHECCSSCTHLSYLLISSQSKPYVCIHFLVKDCKSSKIIDGCKKLFWSKGLGSQSCWPCIHGHFWIYTARKRKNFFKVFFKHFLCLLNIWATKLAQFLLIGLFWAANEAKM